MSVPIVVDHRVGLPIRWESWDHWRTAQKPRSPRRNIWVREWVVALGQPITFAWIGWESWRHYRFGKRAPEHVGYRDAGNHQGGAA